MKKFIIILALGAMCMAYQTNGLAAMTANFNGLYTIYTDTYVKNDSNTIRLSVKSLWNAQIAKLKQKNIAGESVSFKGDSADLKALITKLNISKIEVQNLDGVEIIYGYSHKLKGGVAVGGSKINVQIAKRGDTITVGTPLILGSY